LQAADRRAAALAGPNSQRDGSPRIVDTAQPDRQGSAMNAFSRLSRFGTTVKYRTSPIWKSAVPRFERGRLWLTAPRDPVCWKGPVDSARTWFPLKSIAARITAGLILVGLLVVIVPRVWEAYSTHLPAIIPLGAGVGGGILAWAALTQAGTARRRHEEQTKADLQRRITESFSKATEQLGNDKLEVRLGGIYTLERVSRESPDDYWTVVETLSAFTRQRSRLTESERTALDFEQRVSRCSYFIWHAAGRPDGRAEEFWAEAIKQEETGEPPATDIAAVLAVIKRRTEPNRKREGTNAWRLDLSGAILRQATLEGAHLDGVNLMAAHLEGANLGNAHLERACLAGTRLDRANLGGAHLEWADLTGAHLEWATLRGAHLQETILMDAHLKEADFRGAHLQAADLIDSRLEGADLRRANLQGADFRGAHLEGADLRGAHLEGADLRYAVDLSQAQIAEAHGDARTQLPAELVRPPDWPLDGRMIA
jgi:uncharacterized protein YjbI with pentapeptide repeats